MVVVVGSRSWCCSSTYASYMPEFDDVNIRAEADTGDSREAELSGEGLRRVLREYTTRSAPRLDIDSYAKRDCQANRAAGL